MTLAIEITGPVVRLDLNRPDEGNAITPALLEELTQALQDYGSAVDTRVIALTPKGPQFCGGRDISGGPAPASSAHALRTGPVAKILGLYRAVAAAPVPVVACVQGDAHGMGAALAGCADITLVSDTARMSFPEITHDIAPTLAMSAVLTTVAPKALAYLVYSGEQIGAQQAAEVGLASTILPHAGFDEACTKFLDSLASRPRVVLETVKQYHAAALHLPPAQKSDLAGHLMALMQPAL